MYSDENKPSSLAKFLNGYDCVIIDTCSLMEESFPEFMEILHKGKPYRKKGQEVLIPRKCFDELKKHVRQRKDDSKRIDAKRGLRVVRRARFFKVVKITKRDANENFADNAIFVRVSNDRLFARILIVTQDKKLATDLLALNQLKSQMGKPIGVFKLIPGGRLVPNKGEETTYKERTGHGAPSKEAPKQTTGTSIDDILAADARLSAVLSNPNYPLDKKIADVKTQLRLIDALPPQTRGRLSLNVSVQRMQDFLADNGAAKPKPEPKKEEPKPEPKKVQDPNRLWYEKGKTVKEGIAAVCQHYGIVFHEANVQYFKEGHGPYDLTTKDLDAIDAKAMPLITGEDKVSFDYRGLRFSVQHANDYYRCWVDANHLPEALEPLPKAPRKTAKKLSEAEEGAAPKTKATTKKVKTEKTAESSKKPQNPIETEEKPKKTKVKKAVAEEQPIQAEEAKPAPKKAPAKKKAEAPKEEPLANPGDTPSAEKPTVKKSAGKKKADSKPKPTPEPKAEPAPEENKQPEEDPLADIKRKERRLQTVLPNGNYPHAKKIRDVKAQMELVAALTPEQQATLKLGLPELQKWLDEHPLDS